MSKELYETTKRLLQQLNHFIIHVVIYFCVNIGLILAAFNDVAKRWWLFFIIFFWALGLIYHGLRVYGVDIINPKKKKVNLL